MIRMVFLISGGENELLKEVGCSMSQPFGKEWQFGKIIKLNLYFISYYKINSRRMKKLHTKAENKFIKKLNETMVNICYKLRRVRGISKHNIKPRSNTINYGQIGSHNNLKVLQGKR